MGQREGPPRQPVTHSVGMNIYDCLSLRPPTHLPVHLFLHCLPHSRRNRPSTEAVWGGTRPLRAVAGGRAPGPHHSPGRLVGTAEPRAGWGTGRLVTEPLPPGAKTDLPSDPVFSYEGFAGGTRPRRGRHWGPAQPSAKPQEAQSVSPGRGLPETHTEAAWVQVPRMTAVTAMSPVKPGGQVGGGGNGG